MCIMVGERASELGECHHLSFATAVPTKLHGNQDSYEEKRAPSHHLSLWPIENAVLDPWDGITLGTAYTLVWE